MKKLYDKTKKVKNLSSRPASSIPATKKLKYLKSRRSRRRNIFYFFSSSRPASSTPATPTSGEGSWCRRGTPRLDRHPRLDRQPRCRRQSAGLEVRLYAPIILYNLCLTLPCSTTCCLKDPVKQRSLIDSIIFH